MRCRRLQIVFQVVIADILVGPEGAANGLLNELTGVRDGFLANRKAMIASVCLGVCAPLMALRQDGGRRHQRLRQPSFMGHTRPLDDQTRLLLCLLQGHGKACSIQCSGCHRREPAGRVRGCLGFDHHHHGRGVRGESGLVSGLGSGVLPVRRQQGARLHGASLLACVRMATLLC